MGQLDKEKYLDKGPPLLMIIFTLVAYAVVSVIFTFVAEFFLYQVGLADPKGWLDRLFTPILLAICGSILGSMGGLLSSSIYGTRTYRFGNIYALIIVVLCLAVDIAACIPGVISTLFPNSIKFVISMVCGLSGFTYLFCSYLLTGMDHYGCSYCGIANIMRFSHSENEKVHYEHKYEKERNEYYDNDLSDRETKSTIVIDGKAIKIDTNPEYYQKDLGLFAVTTYDNVYCCPICGRQKTYEARSEKKVSD